MDFKLIKFFLSSFSLLLSFSSFFFTKKKEEKESRISLQYNAKTPDKGQGFLRFRSSN